MLVPLLKARGFSGGSFKWLRGPTFFAYRGDLYALSDEAHWSGMENTTFPAKNKVR